MMRKNNQGVTLVELLIGIAIGSLVTLAATTVILMGLRLNRQSMDVSSRQNTARVLLNSLEDLAADGSISGFSMAKEGWQVYGKKGTAAVLYSYDAEMKTIFTGGTILTDSDGIVQNRTPIMKNVESSYLAFDDGLLTISVEIEDGVFESKVYCRVLDISSGSDSGDHADIGKDEAEKEAEEDTMGQTEKVARMLFVTTLLNEYRENPNPNDGRILKSSPDEGSQGDFYSKWYIGDGWQENGWNEFTPWCACFVSWAIAEVKDAINYNNTDDNDSNNLPSYAGVDSFLAYFYKRGMWINQSKVDVNDPQIYPGDVIFFDWVEDNVRNPQHVGVVLYVEDGWVHTIEGNVAASYTDPNGRYGTVGLREYKIDDPRILGYGVLDWQTGDLPSTSSEGNS